LSDGAYAAARRRRLHQVLILALGVITLVVYSNSFPCGFTLDSSKMILADSRITALNRTNLALILGQGYWYPIETSGLYRPFTTLSYLLNYTVFGNSTHPAGYHVVNLVLHWLNAALVYLLTRQLLGEMGVAFATAALWAVHPLLTESVTNIVGRADLLAGGAILGALLCYIRATAAGPLKARSIGLLAGLTAIGILSKESVMVLPALMLAYDFTFRRKITRGHWYAYAAVVMPLALWWKLRSLVVQPYLHPFVDNPLIGAGFWTGKLTAVKVVGKYLWLFFFPRTLSSDYSYNQIPLVGWRFDNWEDWLAVAALAECCLLLLFAVYCYRRAPALFFLLAFAVVTFAPTSNFVVRIGSIMAERFMYLPAIGLTACVVAGLAAAGRSLRTPMLAPAALAILCLGLGGRTYARNFDWRTDEALARSTVATSPASFKSHMLLASWLPLNDIDVSIAEIERSLQILAALPDDKSVAVPYSKAGQLYREKAQLRQAYADGGRPWYEKARDVLEIGVRIDHAASRQYRELRLRRGDDPAHIPLHGLAVLYGLRGGIYLRLGEPQKALESLQYGQRLATDSSDFCLMIAQAYDVLHDARQRAVSVLEASLLRPSDPRVASVLAEVFGRPDATGCLAYSVEYGKPRGHMNLSCPAVREQVCQAAGNVARRFAAAGQASFAARIREQALGSFGCAPQFEFAGSK
jgi:hypothetical protein